ncbi:Iron-type alcohol dehydrogenase-like protein, partial [Aduncisulcus paluster]
MPVKLGGFYDLPHGECNAILLPHVEQHNLIANVERFAILAEWLGVDTSDMDERDAADAALEAIRQLSADVGIPAGLKALG